MDESLLVDWYDVVNAVANGRVEGHNCPACQKGTLGSSYDGIIVRLRCPECGMGFEGRLAHGRDDAFYREAQAMEARRAAKMEAAKLAAEQQAEVPTPEMTSPSAETSEAAGPAPVAKSSERRAEPWSWQLPATSGNDMDAYAVWIDVVEAIRNGRRTGMSCPLCSEPLTQITHRPPYIRVRCALCGEGFEGRLG